MKFSGYKHVIMFLLLLFAAGSMVTASTTNVTISRMATDGITPVTEVTRTYQWLETNLPVYGDGTTHYYSQGPTFNGTDLWDDAEWQNVATRDWGAVMGTNLKDLCNLAGGGESGHSIRVSGADMVGRDFTYESIYSPDPRQGTMIVAWKKDGMTPESGYDEGMRLIMLADAKVSTPGWNTSGLHVFGNADMRDCWASPYWYNYSGVWPSSSGTSIHDIRYIRISSSDPVPAPDADFSASIRTGHITNGDFETGTTISPWTGNGATRHTGSATYRKNNGSVKLAATVGNPAWIQQEADLTGVDRLSFWRYTFGGSGKYLQVLVDDTVIANYTDTTTAANTYETIDISARGYTGSHTVKVNAVSATSGTFTAYLDNIADFSPGTSGEGPLTIQFRDLSTKTEDAAHSSWAWDFDSNGVTDNTDQNPLYTFTTDGSYTVTLTTTNAGGSNTEVKTGYIHVGTVVTPPVAGFSVNTTSGTAPLAVAFTDTSSGSPAMWNWSFGDGTWNNVTAAIQKDQAHTYNTAGIYTTRLTVCNAGGCSTTDPGLTITVTPATVQPNVAFTTNVTTGYSPLHVKFTDTSTGSPTMWNWSFGDGTWFNTTTSTQKSPSYVYTTAGIYPARLIACNAGGCNATAPSVTITVTTLNAPIVKFSTDKTSGYAPLAVLFTDTTTGAIRWNWSFGDGTWFNTTTSTKKSPSHVYTTAGAFSAQLIVCNAYACNTTAPAKIITVRTLYPPTVKFSSNVSSGFAPLGVRFTDSSTGIITSWNWSFGDGTWFNTTTSTKKSPSHQYASAGIYAARLIACNAAGCNITAPGKTITVTIATPPLVKFTANVSSGYAPMGVKFTDTTSGAIRWNWSFGDGTWFNTTTSTKKSPSHQYSSAGTYSARLIACNAYLCNTTAPAKVITVTIAPPPNVKFTVNKTSGTAPLAVRFTDITSGAIRWNWSFGDGTWFNTTTSTQKSPAHLYTVSGTYSAQLIACNAYVCNTTAPAKIITIT